MKRYLGLFFFILFLFLAKSYLPSQPYYAAVKGESCAACHVSPSGAGPRKIVQTSPGYINESLALGGDLRGAYSNDGTPHTDYNFKALEQRFYIVAEPTQGATFAYSNESGATAEMYGILEAQDLGHLYLRFGKFFLPYGLQISDADNSSYIKTTPFAPNSVGFSLQPGLTDFGLEMGFNPKKDYFLNLSITNGATKQGSGSAKAVTGRAGLITQNFGLGLTGFQKGVPDTSTDKTVRYGFFGWFKMGPVVLLGEMGQGYDLDKSTGSRKNVSGAYAEINYKFGKIDSYQNDLILKAKMDYINSDKLSSEKFRYTLGLEWFLKEHMSFESQYRFLQERPETNNDQALLLAHLWF